MTEKGTAYGVGVGPGEPELMTLKAVRIIRECDVIAVPGSDPEDSAAYKIAAKSVPEIKNKTLLPVCMPMVRDREVLRREHRKSAALIEEHLISGKNVAYITLGDPTVYCSFSYLQRILEEDGFHTELVSGITSFCAAAARVNIPLAEWNEQLHIIPFAEKTDTDFRDNGNYVFMKSGKRLSQLAEVLRAEGKEFFIAENCGMENERIYTGCEDIPDRTGYFTLVIAKEKGKSDSE